MKNILRVLSKRYGQSLPSECTKANDYLASDEYADNVPMSFRYKGLPKEGVPYYLHFEELFLSCAHQLKVVPWTISPKEPQVSMIHVQSELKEANDFVAKCVFKSIKTQDRLDSLFYEINDEIEMCEPSATLDQAAQQQLGMYTIEQEADELGAEFMNDIGLSPVSMVQALVKIQKSEMHGIARNELNAQQCERTAETWLNQNGLPQFVPVADFIHLHHSTCFRAYDVDREIFVHQYKREDVPHPWDFGGERWAKLSKAEQDNQKQP